MSLRVCANCDYVISNKIHHGNCPRCDSDKMVDPLDDDRDWNKMYKKQREAMLKEISLPPQND